MPNHLDDRLQALLWMGLGAAALALLYLLSPILTPFLLAGILAYVCNPVVSRLERLRLPRSAGAVVVLCLLGAALILLLLILVPLVQEEATLIAARLPEGIALMNDRLLPWLNETFGISLQIDAGSLKALAGKHAGGLETLAQKLLESLKIGGGVLFGLAVVLMLTPVVMFYLLVDWPALLARFENALPRSWHGKAVELARRIDAVLAEFLRGQLSVMLILAVYYSAALALASIPSAVPLGLLTGLLIFIPYLGYATGLILALIVAALQFEGISPVIAVLVVFGIGQLLESFLLTPFLVGERIGLHPLAVIFALMAFGQLFGFFGVLLALPVSAALLIGLREIRTLYLASRFYRGKP